MGSRESYDEALARRLALLRAELTGERAAAEAARAREEKAASHLGAEVAAGADAGIDGGVTAIRAPGRHASRRFAAGGVGGVGARVTSRVPAALLAPGPIAVVAVLLAVGIGVVAWLTLRSQPQELPMAVPVAGDLASPIAVPGVSTGAARTTNAVATEVVVHVAGKVRRPGIVVLSPGARVADALRAAGGARPGIELAGVNLARVLADGEQVVVGAPVTAAGTGTTGMAGATGAGGDAAGKVNLNTASEAQLEELPGVGPVTAAAIVAFRQEQGPFVSVDQLLDVSGIGEATLAEIAPHATV
ncbi:ComEA family DNA-binding protein [Nocardioides sp.]|uniref:ComEA family DNA-binding protein n=1 Tax=Nocardioides sp. TaxID=35761 RepID=UPI002D03C1D3|nr:ComEA family DNA-binding protein [Nocardioides sp.]HSX67420.1 ComEA family DNA-binding protein [Nocardioides sp.]